MSMTVRAAARNEELFRRVNEQIEAISQSLPGSDPNMDFLCECDEIDCAEKIIVTLAEYESVRAVPTHFVVLPAHVDRRVEHVVTENERFAVVEKQGAAARDAEEHEPRDDEER